MKIAMDIGGTFTRFLIKDELIKIKTINLKLEYILKLIQKYKIKKIGISFAGQVNNNKILSSPNTTLNNEFFDKLRKHTKIKIENDLKCAGIFYKSKYKKNFALLFSGTGIGSCYFDKNLIKGVGNLAGEIGHIPYKKAPFKCGCGKDNCLELYASGSGIKKWLKYYNMNQNVKLKSLKGSKIFKEYILALQKAIAIIITMLNPKILILGGGVIENNRWILDELELEKYTFSKSLKMCEIKINREKQVNLKGALKLWK